MYYFQNPMYSGMSVDASTHVTARMEPNVMLTLVTVTMDVMMAIQMGISGEVTGLDRDAKLVRRK